MAQAVVLQTEILAKDVSAVDTIWVDAIKSQERNQLSYTTKTYEIVEAVKKKKNFQGETVHSEPKVAVADRLIDGKFNNRNINEG